MRIGIFDSGLGGLTILNAVRELLPEYDYIYYGDTKNLPYGDKSEEEICVLTKRAVEELFRRECALVVIACNTASAESLRTLQETLLVGEYQDRRILGVIIPTVEVLIECDAKNVLLVGTNRTINSKKYDRELAKRNANSIKLISVPTPALVLFIEKGDLNNAYKALERIVTQRVGEVDTIVLGCTHYTVLKNDLRKHFPKLRIISQDEIIPEKLKVYLAAHPEIESRISRFGSFKSILTGEV